MGQVTPLAVNRLTRQAKTVVDVPMDTGRCLIKCGIGVGFFTKFVISPDVEAGQIKTLSISDFPSIFREIALVRLARQKTLSAVTTNFIRLIEQ